MGQDVIVRALFTQANQETIVIHIHHCAKSKNNEPQHYPTLGYNGPFVKGGIAGQKITVDTAIDQIENDGHQTDCERHRRPGRLAIERKNKAPVDVMTNEATRE